MAVVEVLINCKDREEALSIGEALLRDRVVASFNVYGAIESGYHWQGGIHSATEVPLLLKSTPQMWEEIQARVHALHSYDTPAIIRRELTGVNARYADWVHQEVRSGE